MTQATALASPDPARWRALGFLFLGSALTVVDVSIVNVALPGIAAATGASETELEWVAAAYILAFALGLLPFGRFGDAFGRRLLFLWGLSGFTLMSLLCGLAPGIGTLIAARAGQGLTAALMMPQVLAIAHTIFPEAEKPRVFGRFGMVTSLGAVAGPVLGGLLIALDPAGLGWRSVFLVNLPLGLLALWGAARFVPVDPLAGDRRFDLPGTALFALIGLLAVLPLIEGRLLGWPWYCLAALASVPPLVLAFLALERHRARRALPALIPPGLLRDRLFAGRILLVLLFFSGLPGSFLILAIFLQSGLGETALATGLTLVPFPLAVSLAARLSPRLAGFAPALRIASGTALMALGLLVLRSGILMLDPLPLALIALPLFLSGFGTGIAVVALFPHTLSSVSASEAGAGSGAVQAFQQLGAVLGIALIGQLFFATLGPMTLASPGDFTRAAAGALLYPISLFALMTLWIAGRHISQRKAIA